MTVHNIGRYDILYAIGSGSHGTVMCAHDTLLQRKVALKAIKSPSLTLHTTATDWLEAKALARLNHPNIVSIHEVFEDHDTAYLVTEFVSGESLSKRLTNGALDFEEAVSLSLKLADGLRSVHANGLVHADIKPDNIMIREDGEPVLVDFGIARTVMPDDQMMTLDDDDAQSISKIEGTLAYMAPEIIRGEQPTPKSDIFSLGTVIYEMLTGLHAFKQKTQAGTMRAVLTDQPLPLHKKLKNIPEGFSDLIKRMMAHDVAGRPDNMATICRELNKWSRDRTNNQRPLRVRTFIGLSIAAGLALLIIWQSDLLRPPTSISGQLGLGFETLKTASTREEIDDTISVFQRILLRAPENAAATAGLSLGLTRKYAILEKSAASLEQARALAEISVALDDQLAISHIALARVYQVAGEDTASEQSYLRAFELEPSNFFAFQGYGRLLIKRHDLEAAEQNFATGIGYHPDESGLYDLQGQLYFQQQKYSHSQRSFLTSLELNPDNVYAYASLSATHYMQGDIPAAIATLQRGLQVRRDAILYSNLGTYFFALGQYPQSADAFERALEMRGSSDDYQLWANLADAYRETSGQETEAVNAYRRALIALAPLLPPNASRPQPLSRAALYHAKAGEFEAAKTRLREALELASTDSRILFRAAVTSEIVGDRMEALRYIRGALENGYPLEIIKSDPDLTALRQDKEFLKIILNQNQTKGD